MLKNVSVVILDRKQKEEMAEKIYYLTFVKYCMSNLYISRILYFMGFLEFVSIICPWWTIRPVETKIVDRQDLYLSTGHIIQCFMDRNYNILYECYLICIYDVLQDHVPNVKHFTL